jgi:NitT/TauT family transport system ATP-binding protein
VARGTRIQLLDIAHSYESQLGNVIHALLKTSLSIAAGEFVAIVGPSGCGKTTLLNLVGGLLAPSEGEVLIDSRLPKAGAPGLRYLFARDCLLGWRTAAQNVALPLEVRGVSRRERETRVAAMLAVVGLKDFAGASIRTIAGNASACCIGSHARHRALDPSHG